MPTYVPLLVLIKKNFKRVKTPLKRYTKRYLRLLLMPSINIIQEIMTFDIGKSFVVPGFIFIWILAALSMFIYAVVNYDVFN